MKSKLSKSEEEILDGLTKELYSPTTIDKFSGAKTSRIMEINKVESPSLKGAIKISSSPNTYVVPTEIVTEENKAQWIERMKIKYRVN